AATPFGIAPTLLLAGCAGVALYDARSRGILAGLLVVALWAALYFLPPLATGTSAPVSPDAPSSPTLWNLAAFFLKVSALTFGGGLAILAFVQEYVVNRMQ